jgi:hypothetical protein
VYHYGLTVLYVVCMWVTVRYIFLLLSHCLIAISFMSFAPCYVLIKCYVLFNYSFYVCFLVLYYCFPFCVFCVSVLFCVLFIPVYIVVYFLFVYNFTGRCHRVKNQLQLINIISHYYVTPKLLIYVILPGNSFLRTFLLNTCK